MGEWLASRRGERLEELANNRHLIVRLVAAIFVALDSRYEIFHRWVASGVTGVEGVTEVRGRHYKQSSGERAGGGRHFAKPAPVPALSAEPAPVPALREQPAPVPALRAQPAPARSTAPAVAVRADIPPASLAASDRVCDDQAWARWEAGIALEDRETILDELMSGVSRAERLSVATGAMLEQLGAWDRRLTERSLGWFAPLRLNEVIRFLKVAAVVTVSLAVVLALVISPAAHHAPSAHLLPPGAFGVPSGH